MTILLKFLYKSLEFTIFKKNKHPTSICLKHWLSNIWITFFLQGSYYEAVSFKCFMSNNTLTQSEYC